MPERPRAAGDGEWLAANQHRAICYLLFQGKSSKYAPELNGNEFTGAT
jgi:hypothetical protein